eukprot:2443652-Rhodomonas_salina.1
MEGGRRKTEDEEGRGGKRRGEEDVRVRFRVQREHVRGRGFGEGLAIENLLGLGEGEPGVRAAVVADDERGREPEGEAAVPACSITRTPIIIVVVVVVALSEPSSDGRIRKRSEVPCASRCLASMKSIVVEVLRQRLGGRIPSEGHTRESEMHSSRVDPRRSLRTDPCHEVRRSGWAERSGRESGWTEQCCVTECELVCEKRERACERASEREGGSRRRWGESA